MFISIKPTLIIAPMSHDINHKPFKKLLDRLQEDSWQLELLVSGFTIFGLFYALKPVGDAFQQAINSESILRDVYQTVFVAILILIFNLIIHLILRSLWIGALGVRYVSGDIDFEKLKYNERFTNYLSKKVGTFDSYIERLEKLCSIIFAISFLLIFYVVSIFTVLHLINFVGAFYSEDTSLFVSILVITVVILLIIGAVLTFIDYLTQGRLKRYNWIAKLYFPFYWLFSYLTLSFLYRPLYYNLINNKFGRRVCFFLLPFYFLVLFIVNMYEEPSAFISLTTVSSNTIRANSRNYEDMVEKNEKFISVLAIQSKVITDSYLKIKVPLSSSIENNIEKFNKNLVPYKAKRLYKTVFDTEGETSYSGGVDSLHQVFLNTFQQIYSFKIDSISYHPEFVIAKDESELSIEGYVGTSKLTEGKHVLVYSRYKNPDNDSIITIKEIPFWYYKD